MKDSYQRKLLWCNSLYVSACLSVCLVLQQALRWIGEPRSGCHMIGATRKLSFSRLPKGSRGVICTWLLPSTIEVICLSINREQHDENCYDCMIAVLCFLFLNNLSFNNLNTEMSLCSAMTNFVSWRMWSLKGWSWTNSISNGAGGSSGSEFLIKLWKAFPAHYR